MEPGICNPQPSPPRESYGSGDPPLTSDGLQIRQNKGPIEVEKPDGDRHPLTGRASPQMTPKTPRPTPKRRITHELLAPRRGEKLKSKTSRPLPKGRGWERGKKGQKTKESLQLTIYTSEQIN